MITKFNLEMSTKNAAFDEDKKGAIATILRQIADDLDSGGSLDRSVFDVNGNRVGEAWTEEDEFCDSEGYEGEMPHDSDGDPRDEDYQDDTHLYGPDVYDLDH